MEANLNPGKKNFFGDVIPIDCAKRQHEAFLENPPTEFPVAVCYRIEELLGYLEDINTKFEDKSIPVSERGVALTFGLHKGNRSHALNKVTVMMIPTQYLETNPSIGMVDYINNPIVTTWPTGQPSEFEAICYDAASLYP